MKQLFLYSLLFCIVLSGFSQGKPQHALSIGFQMPAADFPVNANGVTVRNTAFPITFRYSATFLEQHQVGITLGGRTRPAQTIILGMDPILFPSFVTYESRIDYRWFLLGTEKKFQPFLGAGVWTTFSVTDNPVGASLFINQTFQIIPGLRYQLSDRFFLSTELPMSLTSLWNGSLTAFETIWRTQRNQLWPVISVGVNL